MNKTRSVAAFSLLLFALCADVASAACVNRFTARTERPRQVLTILTGRLTFQEAQKLAALINSRKSPPLEWVNAEGKTLARQYGELKVLRPMPVGCNGRTSGVVMVASFATSLKAEKKLFLKLNPSTTIALDQQAE